MNKGSTIVLVLVVLAVVGIIATVALWIALSNFNMKITDQKTTKSFYSAEEVLDQIRAGLQGDVSEALETAYTKEQLNDYDFLVSRLYNVDSSTQTTSQQLNAEKLLSYERYKSTHQS